MSSRRCRVFPVGLDLPRFDGQPRHWPQPGRAEHQNPRHGRCAGFPDGIVLTPRQAHDLQGADVLLKDTPVPKIITDRACDAKACVPPKISHQEQRSYGKQLYQARHLIENFFARVKQYRAIATRYDKTARRLLSAIWLVAAMDWIC